MPLIPQLPLLPADATPISPSLAIQEGGDRIVFFNAAGPIYACRKDDHVGLRLGAQTMIQQELAGVGEIADALGVHRTTLFRDRRRLQEEGAAGLAGRRRGPKGPRVLTPERLQAAQDLLDRGTSVRAVASEVGVSEGSIRNAFKRGQLSRGRRTGFPTAPPKEAPEASESPSARAAEDQACEAGVAVKRTLDRTLASTGKLAEAPAEFEFAESVPNAGVLLALPALLEQGLIEVGTRTYGRLRNGFFGLRSVLLTFAFMALLRIRTPEQITEKAPGELGRILGLDRAPEVKTLRRKLRELGATGQAHDFMRRFTERWAKADARQLGILYVDGHVRPYHGRTHKLPKLHVQQRGRAMPGTKDFHVGDRRADPLFFVTAEANEGLLTMIETEVIPEVRRLVGPNRRILLVFDREGWSPKRFAAWKEQQLDVLTYRKGTQRMWRTKSFQEVTGKIDGRRVSYWLAEREVKLSNGLKVREIRRLTEDGHQTSIITTNTTLRALEIAHRMFSRWRQENFFRYMRHEFALDHLCTNATEPADPTRPVSPPERLAKQKQLQKAKAARSSLLDRRLTLKPGEKARVQGKLVDEEDLDRLIAVRDVEIDRLKAALAKLPKKVPIAEVLEPEEIVKLERERKVVVDAIKLTAFRAESTLARVIEPFFAKHEDEARKFLKSIFQATADVIPDKEEQTLTIRFHGLSSPRASRALSELCDLVSKDAGCYPGTSLQLRFETLALQK